MTNPQTLGAWYDLIRRVFADLRGAAFRQRKAKQASYRALFEEFQSVHKAYVTMIVEFKYALSQSDAASIAAAKAGFLDKRAKGSAERALLRFEADALSGPDLTDEEKSFLGSIRRYLIYRNSPDEAGVSGSGFIWMRIEMEDHPATLKDLCDRVLGATSEAYAQLVSSYVTLDPAYQIKGDTT